MKARTTLRVVDTNVALTANGQNDAASAACVAACARSLARAMKGRLAVDDKRRIVGEYMNKLRAGRQRGPGDAFLKWVLTNHDVPHVVHQVKLTPRHDPTDFDEVPPPPPQASYDPSDRKFLAVAAAHPENPRILQASDSKWWGWKETLASHGVHVEFLCPKEISQTYARKSRKKSRKK